LEQLECVEELGRLIEVLVLRVEVEDVVERDGLESPEHLGEFEV
jgi:hypothetical protein